MVKTLREWNEYQKDLCNLREKFYESAKEADKSVSISLKSEDCFTLLELIDDRLTDLDFGSFELDAKNKVRRKNVIDGYIDILRHPEKYFE